jgi:lipid-binding SYLF domain-containing protein
MRIASIALAAMFVASPLSLLAGGCAASPASEVDRGKLADAAASALAAMEASDASLAGQVAGSYAYAVFPDAGEGAFIIGGGGGHGVVYRGGDQIGWCSIMQVTIGAQIGGKGYSMVILFENAAAFDSFKRSETSGIAGASAVAATAGAAANAPYTNGVKVVVSNQAGLMAAANIGGQSIKYQPLN